MKIEDSIEMRPYRTRERDKLSESRALCGITPEDIDALYLKHTLCLQLSRSTKTVVWYDRRSSQEHTVVVPCAWITSEAKILAYHLFATANNTRVLLTVERASEGKIKVGFSSDAVLEPWVQHAYRSFVAATKDLEQTLKEEYLREQEQVQKRERTIGSDYVDGFSVGDY